MIREEEVFLFFNFYFIIQYNLKLFVHPKIYSHILHTLFSLQILESQVSNRVLLNIASFS